MTDIACRADAGFQRRTFPVGDLELRASKDGDSVTFEGVAATVDHAYTVRDWMGEFTETIRKGAFDRTLDNTANRVSLFVNHVHQAIPLGTRKAGTLELVADPHLRVKADLDPARPDVQILRSAIERGEMSEMSIGFSDVEGGSRWNDDFDEVVITELALREVSVVEEGANDATLASVRSWLVDMARIRPADISDAEIQRAVEHLQSMTDTGEKRDDVSDKQIEDVIAKTGLVVTDEMVALFNKRR